MNYDIFLSYAREDLAAVQSLVSAIEAEGLSVFWDRQIMPGQSWSDVLEVAMNDSRAVVVVWSAASVKSTWVKAEATEAMARGKLVPVRIDDAVIPMPFGQVQTADVVPGRPLREQGVSIAAAIAALAVAGAVAPTSAAHAPPAAAGTANASSMVNWRHAFLLMEGRLSRRDYWIYYFVLVPLGVLCTMVVEYLVGASVATASLDVKVKAAVYVYVLMLYPGVALLLKRLHDFGWSGWWSLPSAVICLFANGSAPYLTSEIATERYGAWFFRIVLWSIVAAVGARAGDPGVNKYGPPHGGCT